MDDAPEPATPTPVAAHLLPSINQRVTITTGPHVPVPSRVEDIGHGQVTIAYPSIPLTTGGTVTIAWERDGSWFNLESRVLGTDEHAAVPTARIASGGRLSRHDERRLDVRRRVELSLQLRVIRGRAVRPGRDLQTTTTDVSASAVSFATNAPLAPGDLLEARIQLGTGPADVISARVRVIRIDTAAGTRRGLCTAAFEEILRSDRARVVAVSEAIGEPVISDVLGVDAIGVHAPATPPTADGIGGRDEPDVPSPLEHAVAWLRRRG